MHHGSAHFALVNSVNLEALRTKTQDADRMRAQNHGENDAEPSSALPGKSAPGCEMQTACAPRMRGNMTQCVPSRFSTSVAERTTREKELTICDTHVMTMCGSRFSSLSKSCPV